MRAIMVRLTLAALIVGLTAACAKYPVVSSPSASAPTMAEPDSAR